MQKQTQINQELELTDGLQSLATAYEQISVMKMQEVRGSVVSTRNFLAGLSDLFYILRRNYQHQVEELLKKAKETNQAMGENKFRKNGRQAFVLLSANNKLYGDIIPKTISLFLDRADETDADLIIVGKVGKEVFEHQNGEVPYTYFDIPDAGISLEDLRPLLTFLVPYERVTVFHGQFENVINQVPKEVVVTGEPPEASPQENQKGVEFHSLFEPSLETILSFFESQIFSSLMKQTVQEGQLARFASRIRAMEQALDFIRERQDTLKLETKHAKHEESNKKQLNALAGIKLWKK